MICHKPGLLQRAYEFEKEMYSPQKQEVVIDLLYGNTN